MQVRLDVEIIYLTDKKYIDGKVIAIKTVNFLSFAKSCGEVS